MIGEIMAVRNLRVRFIAKYDVEAFEGSSSKWRDTSTGGSLSRDSGQRNSMYATLRARSDMLI